MAYEATGGAMQPSGMGSGALARAEDGGPPLAIRGSFWARLLSVIIDGVILAIPQLILELALGGRGERTLNALAQVISVVYSIGFWVARGQTPGGMVMGLRLVNAAGENPSLGTAIIRYFAQILSAIPLMLGFLWALGEKRRTWHDMLAGTWVIKPQP